MSDFLEALKKTRKLIKQLVLQQDLQEYQVLPPLVLPQM
jgi:hypothetical protein